MQQHRLVSLTGPGGCGKTRLAISAAREFAPIYPMGCWWVDLAALTDPELVLPAVATTFGIRERPRDQLIDAVASRVAEAEMLLILDNCEHLVDACAQLVSRLLDRCPALHVLTTSRAPLDVMGEQSWPVPPLSTPDPGNLPPLESLRRYDAVRLLVERAVAVDPAFLLTERNALAIARVCRRLDGLPLAVELAAARTRTLPIEDIADRLDQSLRILTHGSRTVPPRQRTLRATIDWSNDLLGADERAVWRRLSVFAGGFTLDAAETVCVGAPLEQDGTLDILCQLVDKSLVEVTRPAGGVRYRLLEVVREYGLELLADAGEESATRDRHASYFLQVAMRSEPMISTRERRSSLDRLADDLDNFRAALEWSMQAGGDNGPRLAQSLLYFWWFSGQVNEGRKWLQDAISRTGDADDHRAELARSLTGSGLLACVQGEFGAARAELRRAVDLWRVVDDPCALAEALRFLSGACEADGDPATARPMVEESLTILRGQADQRGTALSLARFGIVAAHQHDYPAAAAALEESILLTRQLGDDWALAVALRHQGMLALAQQNVRGAWVAATESLTLVRDQGDRYLSVQCAETLAAVYAAGSQWRIAATLFGALERQRQEMAIPVIYRQDYEQGMSAARTALGSGAFDHAFKAGRLMPLEQAIDLAMDGSPESVERQDAPALSAREAEVLTLVARGLTNSQVASALFLSARTINWHLTAIYLKLGVTSRTEAVRLALDRGMR